MVNEGLTLKIIKKYFIDNILTIIKTFLNLFYKNVKCIKDKNYILNVKIQTFDIFSKS